MSESFSVIVVSYNIARELPRTLYSLSPHFQEGVTGNDYEIIVVDNGGSTPPTPADVASLDVPVTILTVDNASPSPSAAINLALRAAKGEFIGVFIDGARLASPGLLRLARDAYAMDSRSIVATRGRYLGPGLQRDSVHQGYSKEVEDAMLEEIDWQNNGYRLFEVSVMDESAGHNWWDLIAESNSLFMSKTMWDELGGYDERFVLPGGGLVNLDTWRRACELSNVRPTVLIGEATFHQLHGGVATSGNVGAIEQMFAEYEAIRKRDFERPDVRLFFLGSFHYDVPDKEFEIAPKRKRPSVVVEVDVARPRGYAFAQKLPRPLRRRAKNLAQIAHWVRTGQLREQLALRKQQESDANLIRTSPYFDGEWYLRVYDDVREGDWDPAMHYVRFGLTQFREPGPDFDANWYLDRYVDVAEADANPLVHFVRYGEAEGRRPHSSVRADRDMRR